VSDETLDYQERVRRLLAEIRTGDGRALEPLLDEVGDELRKLSAYRLWLKGHHTIQTTTLVKEVVLGLLRIVKQRPHTFPDSKEHFLALATKMMICTLADHARRRKELVPIDDERSNASLVAAISEDPGPLHSWSNRDIDTMLSVEQALDRIQRSDQRFGHRRRAALELRLFGGMKYTAIARELGVTDDIARNDCITGLATLRQLLTLDSPPSSTPRA
jgi:DNA-directed RNA polymerase specialized sigma24 family protein